MDTLSIIMSIAGIVAAIVVIADGANRAKK